MSENQPCISETIKLSNGEIVKFANIDMTSFSNCGVNIGSHRYLKPIVDIIGHPVLATVNHPRSGSSIPFYYAIYFVEPSNAGEKEAIIQIISNEGYGSDTFTGDDRKPIFDNNIEYYRQFEITAHDAWTILQKLQEEQRTHEATKEKIRLYFEINQKANEYIDDLMSLVGFADIY